MVTRIESSTLLAGACRWINDNLGQGGYTRLELAGTYVKGQDDLTSLRIAVGDLYEDELDPNDELARDQIAELLASLSEDKMCIIDLTLEEVGYPLARA